MSKTITIIHTTQGFAQPKWVKKMTFGQAINAAGFQLPGPDTAIKVRRGDQRIEVLVDERAEAGDVVSLAKSGDGGS